WYVAGAQPGAELYVGLRRGVARAEFQRKITDGTVADCFHRVPVKPGDVMVLPSGRMHAIGAGIVLFEIQQNSDTTYRVFDWNRPGLDGKPRELHVAQSLLCIDFDDFEPAPITGEFQSNAEGTCHWRTLANDPLFVVKHIRFTGGESQDLSGPELEILGVLEGRLTIGDGTEQMDLCAGEFCLKPAGLERVRLRFQPPANLLHVTPR